MTATMSVPGTYDKEADQVVWTDGYVAPHASDDGDDVDEDFDDDFDEDDFDDDFDDDFEEETEDEYDPVDEEFETEFHYQGVGSSPPTSDEDKEKKVELEGDEASDGDDGDDDAELPKEDAK